MSKSRKGRRGARSRRALPSSPPTFCSSLHPDDGVDPRHETRDGASAAVDPATRRLCGNVAHTLTWLLHGLVEDAALQGVEVVRVEPAPDASRLRVLVRVPDDGRDRGVVLARLEAARGWLRTEVAAEVRRRRAPDLAFVLERASP